MSSSGHKEKLRSLLTDKKPLVMGIINCTPDSFSGDGVMRLDIALSQAEQMVHDGADLLDIGGESTRPNAATVSAEEEMARVLPVIAAIRHHLPETPLSIDSFKPTVVATALQTGASFINDIMGGRDAAMLRLAATHEVPIVLMHNNSRAEATTKIDKIGASYAATENKNFWPDLLQALRDIAQSATQAGILPDRIILDPGIGFGKTVNQNLQILHSCKDIVALGYPVLIGASRKSFIGQLLNAAPDERLAGSLAAAVLAATHSAKILRVHDVKETVQALKLVGI